MTMLIKKRLIMAMGAGTLLVAGGVTLANNSSNQPVVATSLQDNIGNSALIEALGGPQTELTASLGKDQKPKVTLRLDGQEIPTNKPGVSAFSHTTPAGEQVQGQVMNSGENTGNVNIKVQGQNTSLNVNATSVPGTTTVVNQTTTTTSLNNSFNSVNSSSMSTSANFNSNTTFSSGSVQQNP